MTLYTFKNGTVIALKYVVVVEPEEIDETDDSLLFTVRMVDQTWVTVKNSKFNVTVLGDGVYEGESAGYETTERENLIKALSKLCSC